MEGKEQSGSDRAGSRRVRLLLSQLLEQEFGRRPILLLGIARYTARDHIAFGTASTPGERHDVIHGQFMRSKRALTVCTAPLGNFIAPPLGLT